MDDDYGDFDIDDIPQATLQEIELQATHHSASQYPSKSAAQPQTQPGLQDDEDEYGFGQGDVLDLNTGQTGFVAPPPAASAISPKPSISKPVDEVTAREQWRAQRYGAHIQPTTVISRNGNNGQPTAAGKAQAGGDDPNLSVHGLQAQVAQLLREHEILKKDHDSQKQAALMSAGETAIVRSNTERIKKEYEKRIEDLRRKAQEAETRHAAEIEASKKQREKMDTDAKFMRHELQQESEKARLARRAQKNIDNAYAAAKRASPLSTPSKKRTRPPGFDDGFDNAPLFPLAVTPSKIGRRDGEQSTTGAKRKHSDLPPDSPSVNGNNERQSHSESATPQQVSFNFPTRGNVGLPAQNDQFQFAQMVLDHRTRTGARFIEVLSRQCIPSKPHLSLASAVYDALRPPPGLDVLEKYQVKVCEALLGAWAKCLEETTYEPITDIVDLLIYIVCFAPYSLAGSLLDQALPLCRQTVKLLSVPRHLLAKNAQEQVDVPEALRKSIRPLELLHFLQELASYCSYDSPASLNKFWTVMEHDFVLLALSKGQPLTQIKLMLTILLSSITSTSFGTLPNPSKVANLTLDPALQQTKTEHELISRLIVLLVGAVPRPPLIPDEDDLQREPRRQSNGDYLAPATLAVRTQVLVLFQRLAATPHGSNLLATHRLVIARLVRFIHDSVSNLYAYVPSTHAATTGHINTAVAILDRLTRAHGESIDLRAKLAVEPGGGYKHLIGLSRVAFAEGTSVIESGIRDDVKEMAHRMLDEVLSPDEGEGVMAVFNGRGPRKGDGGKPKDVDGNAQMTDAA